MLLPCLWCSFVCGLFCLFDCGCCAFLFFCLCLLSLSLFYACGIYNVVLIALLWLLLWLCLLWCYVVCCVRVCGCSGVSFVCL